MDVKGNGTWTHFGVLPGSSYLLFSALIVGVYYRSNTTRSISFTKVLLEKDGTAFDSETSGDGFKGTHRRDRNLLKTLSSVVS